MSNSYALNRVLLKDNSDRYFRIFSYAFAADSRGEKYLKIVFPDLSDKPVGSIRLANSQQYPPMFATQKEADGIREFSLHYRGGASHYKDSSGVRLMERHDVSKLEQANLLHILRLTIYRLDGFRPYDKTISQNDFEIPITFGMKGRIFNLYLVNSAFNIDIEPADAKTNLLAAHAFSPTFDPEVRLIVSDSEFLSLPETKESFSLFTYDDVTAPSRPPV